MSEVYRYDLSLPTNAKNFGMRLSENGCWVEHESYAALESELAALRAAIVALAEEWEGQASVAEGMANDPDTKARIESWRNAATELQQLAEGSSAAAQEGL